MHGGPDSPAQIRGGLALCSLSQAIGSHETLFEGNRMMRNFAKILGGVASFLNRRLPRYVDGGWFCDA